MSHLAIWHFKFRSFRGSASRIELAVKVAGTKQFYFAPDISWETFQYRTLFVHWFDGSERDAVKKYSPSSLSSHCRAHHNH